MTWERDYALDELRANLSRAPQIMKYTEKHWRDEQFEVGDEVFWQNLRLKKFEKIGCTVLWAYGPFNVI